MEPTVTGVNTSPVQGRPPRNWVLDMLVRVIIVAGVVMAALVVLVVVSIAVGGFEPTGDGLGPEEGLPQGDDWELALGPADAVHSQYVPGRELREPPGDEPAQVTVVWTTSSRTPAQACADFQAGISDELVARNVDPVLSVTSTGPAGQCRIDALNGLITVDVVAQTGSAPGAVATLVQQRP